MARGEAREGKWRGNWRTEWVANTLHTTSEHGVSSITTADAHTSAASTRLNWRPRRIKWTRPFRRKTKSGFCACAITFQTQSTVNENNLLYYSNNNIWMMKIWYQKNRKGAAAEQKDEKIICYFQKRYYKNVHARKKIWVWHGLIIRKLLTGCHIVG
jgi:hypothetical protein